MRIRLVLLLALCVSYLAPVCQAVTDRDVSRFIDKIGTSTPYTTAYAAARDGKFNALITPTRKTVEQAGPMRIPFSPKEITIEGNQVIVAGMRFPFTLASEKKGKAKKGKAAKAKANDNFYVHRIPFSVPKDGSYWLKVEAPGGMSQALLNTTSLLPARHGFITDSPGSLGVNLKAGKHSLTIVSAKASSKAPYITCLIETEEAISLARTYLRRNLTRTKSKEVKDRWVNILSILAREGYGSVSLVAEGIELYQRVFKSNSVPDINSLEIHLPDKLRAGDRPTFKAGNTWYESYNNTLSTSKSFIKATLVDFKVMASFPCKSPQEGFKHAYGPESNPGQVDLNKTYEIKGEQTPLRWEEPLKSWKETSVNSLMHFNPTDNRVAYIYKTYRTSQAGRLIMSAGSDDTLTIWHNGKKIFSKEIYRGAERDQETLELDVKAGLQTFLVKVVNGNGGWGFYFTPSYKATDSWKFLSLFETIKGNPTSSSANYNGMKSMHSYASRLKYDKARDVLKKMIAEHPSGISADVHRIIRSVPRDNYGLMMSTLAKNNDLEFLTLILIGNGIETWFIETNLTSLVYMGEYKLAIDLLNSVAREARGHWAKRKKDLYVLYVRVGDALANLGQYAMANPLYREANSIYGTSGWEKNHMISRMNSTSVIEAANRPLSLNPEIELLYEEAKAMALEKEHTRETYSGLYNFIRSYGHELVKLGSGVQNFKEAVLAILEENKDVLAATRAYTQERLTNTIEKAMERNDVEALENIINQFAGFIDTSNLRDLLLKHYMDRGDFDKALGHAKVMLDDSSLRAKAVAYILNIEAFTKVPDEQRTYFNTATLAQKAPFNGKLTANETISRELGLRTASPRAISPGTLITSMDLTPWEPIYRANRNRQRMALSAVTFGGNIVLVSPNGATAYHPTTGKILWQKSRTFGGPRSFDNPFPRLFRPVVVDDELFNLEFSPVTEGRRLVAYDKDGNERWSSSATSANKEWEPISAPFGGFGKQFVFLLSRNRTTAPVLAFAEMDRPNNRFKHISHLYQIKDPVTKKFDLSSQHAYHTVSTAKDREGLYAYTSSGSLIKIGAKSGTLDWALLTKQIKINASRLAEMAPSAVVVGERAVACFMPDVTKWVGVHKRSGQLLWERNLPVPSHIHSRGGNTLIMSLPGASIDSRLVSVDLNSGDFLWSRAIPGKRITGEGITQDGQIFLPVSGGITILNSRDGSVKSFLDMGINPSRLQFSGNQWYVYTNDRLFVCKNEGSFSSPNFTQQLNVTPPKIAKSESSIKEIHTLRQIGSLGYPFTPRYSRDGKLSVISLPHPNYRLLKYTNRGIKNTTQLTVVREPVFQQGRTTPGKVIWRKTFGRVDIIGDKLVTAEAKKAIVYDVYSLTPLYEYTIDKPNTPSNASILSAQAVDNILGIQNKSGLYQIIDMKTSKVINTIDLNADKNTRTILLKDKVVALYSKSLKIFDIKTGTPFSPNVKVETTSVYQKGHYIVMRGRREVSVYDMQHKRTAYSGKYPSYNGGMRIIGDTLYWGRYGAYDLRNKKAIKDISKVLLPTGDGVIYARGKTTHFNDGKHTINIDEDPTKGMLEYYTRERNARCNAFVQGDYLIMYQGRVYKVYSLKDGKLSAYLNPFNGGSRHEEENALWFGMQNHWVMVYDRTISFFKPSLVNHKIERPLVYQVPSQTSPTWPEALPKPATLGKTQYLAGASEAPPRNTSVVFGANADYIYWHTILSKAPGIESQARLSGTWPQGDNHQFFNTQWNEFATHPQGSLRIKDYMTSLKSVDEYGNTHLYVIINKEGLKLDSDRHSIAPNVSFEVEHSKKGKFLGMHRYGGAFFLNDRRAAASDVMRHLVASDDNYKLRETVYSTVNSFYPSGTDLSKWIVQRRLSKGIDNNIAFLEAMVKRTKTSLGVINVLTVLYLEKYEKFIQTHPHEPTILSKFKNERKRLRSEIKSLADGLGIDPEWTKRATTMVEIDLFPVFSREPITLRYAYLSDRHGRRINFDLRGGLQIGQHQQGPTTVLLPFGLFTGRPWEKLQKFGLSGMDNAYFRAGEFRLSTLDGDNVLLNTTGKKTKAVRRTHGYLLHKGVSIMPKQTYGGESFDSWIKFANSGHSHLLLELHELSIAKEPKSLGLTSEALLTSLDNLPTDSKLGPILLGAYWDSLDEAKRKKVDYMALIAKVMKHTNDDYEVVNSLVERGMSYLQREKKMGYRASLADMESVVRKARVPRNLQKSLYRSWNNLLRGKDRWLNLGAFILPKEGELVMDPLPETMAFDRKQEYDVNGKIHRFYMPTDKTSSTDYNGFRMNNSRHSRGQKRLSYHVTQVNAPKTKPVYMYISRTHSHNRSERVSLWVNGRRYLDRASISAGSRGNFEIEVQLNKGKNIVLLKSEFYEQWDLRFSIGNSRGAPLKDYEVVPPR